jgi:hypothetical protein
MAQVQNEAQGAKFCRYKALSIPFLNFMEGKTSVAFQAAISTSKRLWEAILAAIFQIKLLARLAIEVWRRGF